MHRVLLLGSGGREHALAWKISGSSHVEKLFILPGNPGTAMHGINIPGSVVDFQRIREVVLEYGISMVVVGPEDPLALGIKDFFLAEPSLAGVQVIGPSASGARLEGSKEFAKEFMVRQGIPTARYRSFHRGNMAEALRFLEELNPPYVLKADGLAAGKGVVIHHDKGLAVKEVEDILQEGKFGEAGSKIVIEEFLPGIEVSVFVLTDGDHYLMLPEAKDYKKIGEGDTGPNTGGMGSVSPVPFYDDPLMRKVEERIIKPTVEGLKAEGIHYAGFIFFGLMVVAGDPFVIEYNVRLGDPETESIVPRIGNDLVELFQATHQGSLHQHTLQLYPQHAATVMVVSGGYPGSFPKGIRIEGTEEVQGSHLFHAGTGLTEAGLTTQGGRVFGVTTLAESLPEALRISMLNAERIRFPGRYYRKDIGFDVI